MYVIAYPKHTHTHTLPKVLLPSSTERSKAIGLEAFNPIIGPGIHMMPTTRYVLCTKDGFDCYLSLASLVTQQVSHHNLFPKIGSHTHPSTHPLTPSSNFPSSNSLSCPAYLPVLCLSSINNYINE